MILLVGLLFTTSAVQSLRLCSGQVLFGCEVLTEIGMAIKAASSYEHTFVITHCNSAAGYLLPKHLYIEGGYEIRNSPFASQAVDILVRQVVKMLHDVRD